ncbi:MAG: WYL domain-containing protein [Bacteroidota bacterium]|nr:WYL domain-containing protein [Bacteroidota bacterium]
MTTQKSTQTIIEILIMLAGNVNYNIKMLAEKKNISTRTAYRYIDTLRNIGFIIEKEGEYLKIQKENSCYKNISNLLHFSEEENLILSKAILSISSDNLLKQNLIKKLSSIYDFDRVAYSIVENKNSDNVIKLLSAIKTQKQVVLKKYKSNNSNTVSDRIVEPFDFTNNYVSIWCYDTKNNRCKTFKVARITEVVHTETVWRNKPLHKTNITDIFRNSGETKIKVSLKLSLRAKSLLTEEYPLSEEFITPNYNNTYTFNGWVTRYEGIGRFVLGLIDEIKILHPKQLQEYINKKIRNKISIDTI